MSPFNKILHEALKMPAKERARLVEQVIVSLEKSPDRKVEQAWQ